jgi:hypothetical protein
VRFTVLINDLLDASRIDSGRLALHLEPTRLDTIIERALPVPAGAGHCQPGVRGGRISQLLCLGERPPDRMVLGLAATVHRRGV